MSPDKPWRQKIAALLAVWQFFAAPGALALDPTADGTIPLTPQEQAWLADHPVIRLAPDPDFPPIEYLDNNGHYRGIAADYVALIEQKLGIRIQIVRLASWDEVLEKARTREIDMFGAASESPQRAEYMAFTRPHIILPGVIITREDGEDQLALPDLQDRHTAVVSGYVWEDLIRNDYPEFHLHKVPDLKTGLQQVAFGHADAMVANLATASWYIQRAGITNLRVAGESGYFGNYAFAVRKDWQELATILDKALLAISPEEHAAILAKWVHLEVSSPFLSNTTKLSIGVFLSLLSLGIIAVILWNRALKSQVTQRTNDLELQLAQRHEAERALENARRELEQRVSERTSELEESNQRLQIEVDERKRIQDNLERFKTTLDKTLDCVFMFDAQTLRFIYTNQGAVEQVGYSREELLSMTPFDIKPDFTEATFREFIGPFLKGNDKAVNFETIHRHKDGTDIPVEISLQYVVPENDNARFVAIVRDISDRKQIEQELEWNNRQVDIISSAQSAFITNTDPRAAFDTLLAGILELTGSEYGFIGEILHTEDNTPYLRTHAITNIAWNDDTRHFYETHAPQGMEFHNLDTLFGAAIRTGELVIANAPAQDSRSGGLPPGHPALNSFLGLPLYAGERMVGLAGIANREQGYDEHLVRTLMPFSSTCANLIAEYQTEQQRIAAEQRVKISEERMRAVLDNTLESIITIDRAGIIQSINPATEQIFGYGQKELVGQNVKMLMPEPDRSAHDQYLDNYHKTRQPKIMGKGRELEGRHSDGTIFPLELGVTEVSIDDQVMYVGVLRDITQRKEYETALLTARQELQQANEKLLEQSRSDALTGIANRRHFDETLEREMRRARRSITPLSLIICDIDYFKLYNDNYGHLDGDECLVQVAATMKATFRRSGDLCARYGGEEFVVVMPDTDADSARLMAERLRQSIWELAVPHTGSKIADRVSLSIGVATLLPSDTRSMEKFIMAADEALYLAKSMGRNRVAQTGTDPDETAELEQKA